MKRNQEPELALDQFEVGVLANLLISMIADIRNHPLAMLDGLERLRDKLTTLQYQLDQRETEESWRAGHVEVALFGIRTTAP